MSNTYTISSTDGETIIVIGDGATSGNLAGVSNHDTDLLLYGRGTFNWGMGIEQNLIRLTENWSSRAEGSPAWADRYSNVNSQVPITFGATPNKGIVKPLQGQTWFNRSNERLYVNVSDNNTSPKVWKAIGEEEYVKLHATADQQMAGKLRLGAPNGQPDLYIYSNTPQFGIDANIDPVSGLPIGDLGASSYLTFEANKGAVGDPEERVRTAYIAALHKDDNLLRIAVSDRLATNTYSSATNRIDVKADRTEIIHDILHVGASQLSYSIGLSALTTREWVEDHVSSEISTEVTAIGDSQYLKLTGGTVSGGINQVTGSNKIEINNDQITVEANSPSLTLKGLQNDAGQPSLNLADSDITKVSFKMIQGSYSGNAQPNSPRTLASNVDTLVIEKYNTGFNTTQAMIFYDDYIQTHKDNGFIRTPATPMIGETGYDEFNLLTVGKAQNFFCKQGYDIAVKEIDADGLTISNGAAAASIVVHSQNTASITIDASNNLDSVNPSLIFRARGGQRGILRVVPDTGANDSLALLKMNGGAIPNALKMYDDLSTLEKRLEVGGVGDSPSNGSIIINAKDDVTTSATSDYDGSNVTSDYIGIIFKKKNGATVSSILSNNTNELVFRTPTDGAVPAVEAPFMTLSNNVMELQNMRLKAQTAGTDRERNDYDTGLQRTSTFYALERAVAEVTDRRWQEKTLGWQQLFVDVATNAAGWYQSTSRTGDPTLSTYLGLYGRTPVEFDFTDTHASSFTQTFAATNGHIHRVEVHYTIPYMILQGTTGSGSYTGTSFPVSLQYESGPNLDASAVSNVSLGNFSNIVIGELHFPGDGVDLYGRLSGVVLVPCSPGDKVNIRMDAAFGRVHQSYNEYERAVIGDCTFKARIL